MSNSGLEVELKLTTLLPISWSEVLTVIADSLCEEPVRKTLSNTYFDTADGRLKRRRMNLRIRHTGDRYIQTLKLGGDTSALQKRGEWECEVDGLVPDLERFDDPELQALIGLIFGDALKPVFNTEFVRHAVLLSWPQGRVAQSKIELALDHGQVVAGDLKSPIREIELELKEGSTQHLFDLAAHLGSHLPLRPGTGSKAALGERLCQGLPPAPVRAAPPDLDPLMPVAEALPLMLAEACGQWIANFDSAIDGSDPEGVHQFRVALRRLRSLLSLFRPWIAPAAAEQWQAVLRDRLKLAGPARQLDVFIEGTLEPLMAALPDDPALAVVAKAADAERGKVYDALREDLNSRVHGSQALDFLCWIEQGEWRAGPDTAVDLGSDSMGRETLLGDAARTILAKRYRKIRKLGRGFHDMPMEQRHEMRLTLKKLRYAVDFLGPIFADSRVFRKALSQFQDELGVANDLNECQLVMARLSDKARTAAARIALARTDGLITGWSLERVIAQEARTSKTWRKLKAVSPFWEESE